MTDRPVDLDRLFRPSSVAVVGASSDPSKIGSFVIPNMLRCGFRGAIYPVNPSVDEVAGLPCLASARELPEGVDVAYVLVPAGRVTEAARDCADRGVGFAIISAAGFAEDGTEEGARRQAELQAISQETGMRIVGPNCNGLYNATDGVSIGFNASHREPLPAGQLGLVSHSGALFDTLARRATAMGVGLSTFVSVGNEADLDLLDYVEHLAADTVTQVIGLVVDAVPDGQRFRELVGRAQEAGKHVLALKFGESAAGAVASQAHSSRLAGSPRATESLLDLLGVVRVSTVEALVTASALLMRGVDPRRAPGIAGVTMSGAAGAILADSAERHGLALSELTESTRQVFAEHSHLARVVNPVDVGAIGGFAGGSEVFGALFDDPTVSDVVVSIHNSPAPRSNRRYGAQLTDLAQRTGVRLTVLAPGGLEPETESLFREGGAVLTHDTDSTVEALAAVQRAAGRRSQPVRRTVLLPGGWRERLLAGPELTEPEALDLLSDMGVPTVPWREVPDAPAAAAAGEHLGWPVVLKGVVPGVAHKSDLGLVEAGVADAGAAGAAFDRLTRVIATVGDGRVVAEQMAFGRTEVIVGLTTDPSLGQFVVVGLGGVFAEELDEVVLVPVDADREFVRRRVQASTLGRVLASRRWSAAPTEAVLDVVDRLQDLAVAAQGLLHSLDINPLIVGDGRATAVDALVTRIQDLPVAPGVPALTRAPH